ncbi:alpha/beta fold hydrolase [Aurantimonas endophytica]|uniref:Pimeloyl-ACP methyl ester carboxylesterase n=1 Tax=Aurantimonas endophytica TaxID=1522175 RepID=A0A7W6MPR3_9HYPH|nr:alpha/beta hydrolase [Aurantimonas endophytica]MBB4003215.1 pimeloyl-ACP methyl ester carboxylesterase [Aurantimonas endophytica]MCO6404079.1 alpha/beta fold hydrolase [Aurantimonas endophytica]
MISLDLEHRFVTVGSIQLHVVQAGPAKGKPVMLLHGFPDFWFGWRHQFEALACAGFRIIVPDQRGYNTSDKPKGIGEYRLSKLVGDVAGLADALGYERFHLVGHDWGGIVGWAAGAKLPHRVDKLVILNAPHPEALFPYALRSPTQLLRSSYAGFFQFPLLPEIILGARRSAILVRALERSSRQDAFTNEDLADYRRAWEQQGALTAMLNWYRALRFRPIMKERIGTPTLVLWGMQDQALEFGLAQRSLAFCDHGYLETFDIATHWVHREEAAAVNAALVSFLDG